MARRVQDRDAARHAVEPSAGPSYLTKEISEHELADVEPDSLLVDTPRGLLLSVGTPREEGVHIPLEELIIRLAELPDGTDITVVGDAPEDALRAARFLLFRGFEPGRVLVLREQSS